MSRYADIDDLIINKSHCDRDGSRFVYCDDIEPTADVVPVVLCEKCGYWDRETVRQNSNDAGWWNEAICKCHSIDGNEPHEMWTSADWFCADGERRDDE